MAQDSAPEGSIERAAARKPKRLTAVEKVRRDKRIIRDRLKPMTWRALAAKYELDERTVRSVWYEWARSNEGRKHTDLAGRDPIEIVWESAARYENWIEQLADISWSPDTHDAVRVGAINSQMQALEKLTSLLQATGILPKQLGRLRIEADVRYVAQAIVKIFEEEDVPERVQQRIVGVLSPSSSASDN